MRYVALAGVIAAAAAGCFVGEAPDFGAGGGPGASSGQSAGSGGGAATGGDGGAGSTTPDGLPCDVAQVLQSLCVSCHSNPPVGGAPMPLVTYADLTAPAKSDPSKTVAQMCVVRMQSTTAPMPPAGNTPPTAAQIATIQSWVNAGTPMGTCGGAGSDAGSIYNTPVQCTSGQYYSGGGDGSSRMNPGNTCVSCHAQSGGEAPRFTIAGTVYPTAHEPTMCDGVNVAGATVVVTDANNNTLTLPVNSVGNFYTTAAVATPFHAKVVYNGKERAMSAGQTSGDCNACHTEMGANGAPGRIMLP